MKRNSNILSTVLFTAFLLIYIISSTGAFILDLHLKPGEENSDLWYFYNNIALITLFLGVYIILPLVIYLRSKSIIYTVLLIINNVLYFYLMNNFSISNDSLLGKKLFFFFSPVLLPSVITIILTKSNQIYSGYKKYIMPIIFIILFNVSFIKFADNFDIVNRVNFIKNQVSNIEFYLMILPIFVVTWYSLTIGTIYTTKKYIGRDEKPIYYYLNVFLISLIYVILPALTMFEIVIGEFNLINLIVLYLFNSIVILMVKIINMDIMYLKNYSNKLDLCQYLGHKKFN